MGKFTVIPENTFDALQLDAGVLLKRFDPETGAAPDDADIICATTGGIKPSCVAEFSDLGEDIDNVPNNMMELMHLDGWTCTLATTSLGTSAELIALALGCADVEGGKIVPRADLKQTDFTDLWWVGDKANGGFVAIQLKNALSTAGFSLQTTKNGKGQIELEIHGHVSIKAQKEVPMVFYSYDGDDSSGVDVKVEVTFDTDGGSAIEKQSVVNGGKVTRPADPTKENNTFAGWYKENTFTTPWDFDNDTVTSNTTIYAKWTANGTTYTVTFNTNGADEEIDPQTIAEGGTVTRPTDPVKSSGTATTFAGWFEDDTTFVNEWDFDNDTVTGDVTLYAKWE